MTVLGRLSAAGAALAGLFLVAACAGSPGDAGVAVSQAGIADSTAAALALPDSGWTRGPLARRPAAPATAVLRGIRWSPERGYDRLVFQFSGSLPGLQLSQAPGSLTDCASGLSRDVGATSLKAQFSPAQTADSAGHATLPSRRYPIGLAAVKRLRIVCNAGGAVGFGLGLDAPREFRVFALDDPPRIVIDVRHRRD